MSCPQRPDCGSDLIPPRTAGSVLRSLAKQPQFSGTDGLREALQLVCRMRDLGAFLRARRSETLDELGARRHGFFDDFAQLSRIVAENRPQPLDIEDLRVYAAASS